MSMAIRNIIKVWLTSVAATNLCGSLLLAWFNHQSTFIIESHWKLMGNVGSATCLTAKPGGVEHR